MPLAWITANTTIMPARLRKDGRYGGPVEAQGWQSEMPEDEPIVETDIHHGFCQRAIDQEFALVGAYQQRIPHLVDIQEGKAPDADPQERDGLFPECCRMQGPG